VGTALRPIDFIQVFEREFEFAGKVLNPLAEIAFGKRGELVEERLDDSWVENDHNELERYPRRLSSASLLAERKEKKPYMKPINHGTKRSPAHWKMYKNTARKGAPRTKASPQPFRRSVMKSAGVVLLNPCFSSKTNVPYACNGRVGIEERTNRMNTKAMD
jgi:hypothetical protein